MKNGPLKPMNRPSNPAEQELFLVADMVRYLLQLARLYDKDKTGNTELSEGLRHLAHALRQFRHCPVSELTDAINGKKAPVRNSFKTRPDKPILELPNALESISKEVVEEILGNDIYSKEQIAELGVRRFGISRSKLKRQRKEHARESVRAALEHEKSLDVIAMEARRGGKARVA